LKHCFDLTAMTVERFPLPQWNGGEYISLVRYLKRVVAAPEVPTLAEAGLPGFELAAGRASSRPPACGQISSTSWRRRSETACRCRNTRHADNACAVAFASSTPSSFAAYVKTEVNRWAVIVKNSGAKLE
jgi:tripartite-type tricarboxylate transporter receptor subunit TctC